MADPLEFREYLISAERSPEDWERTLQILGELGINAADPFKPDTTLAAALTSGALIEAVVPYRLEEIRSREQYLGDEHAEEFWPLYRRIAQSNGYNPGLKHECLYVGLGTLLHPQPRGVTYRLTAAQKAAYAETLGLKIVIPRSQVGFSDVRSSRSYGTVYKQGQLAVIEVGSFLDYMGSAKDLPREELPHGFSPVKIRFLSALAKHIEVQIVPAAGDE